MSPRSLRIATRHSALALWQAEHVAARLRQAHPGLAVTLVPMSTRGDEILDRALAAIGGKGLFLKELEVALLEDRADIAVHSLKDMPAELDEGFTLAAVLARADVADAFVSVQYGDLPALPPGARVGSSSLRRQAQLRALRPDLQLLDLRGNVQTRLAKLDAGQYDAIILAAAGLERLGLAARIRSRLDAPRWLPAPGQAAIAIEARAGDSAYIELLAPLHDAETATCITAERACNAGLGGSCTLPVGAFAVLGERELHLHALVGDAASGRLLRAELSGPASAPEALGHTLAAQLLREGADALLPEAR